LTQNPIDAVTDLHHASRAGCTSAGSIHSTGGGTQPKALPGSPLWPCYPKTLDAFMEYILDYVEVMLQPTGK